jgi:hypothetical protein
MKNRPDPDPYLWKFLTDPDPVNPKVSYLSGSGSRTLDWEEFCC